MTEFAEDRADAHGFMPTSDGQLENAELASELAELDFSAEEFSGGKGWNPAEIETDYLNTGTFEEVFRSLYPRLYRHASYVAGQLDLKPADVEDILQTAALRAKENWGKYQQGTYALAWFKAIISNTAKNLRRKTFYNKEVNFENFTNEIDMAGYRSQSAESIAIQRLRLEELRALFDQVNEPLRESLKLVLLEEMPYQAVAEKLNIPINTVLTRVYRGRAKLRELINEKRNLDGEA